MEFLSCEKSLIRGFELKFEQVTLVRNGKKILANTTDIILPKLPLTAIWIYLLTLPNVFLPSINTFF